MVDGLKNTPWLSINELINLGQRGEMMNIQTIAWVFAACVVECCSYQAITMINGIPLL